MRKNGLVSFVKPIRNARPSNWVFALNNTQVQTEAKVELLKTYQYFYEFNVECSSKRRLSEFRK